MVLTNRILRRLRPDGKSLSTEQLAILLPLARVNGNIQRPLLGLNVSAVVYARLVGLSGRASGQPPRASS